MKINLATARTILGSFVEAEYTQIDFDLYSQVTDYKSKVASTFKSIGKNQIRDIQGREFYVSLKLDGEHSHLYYDADEEDRAYLIRPRGYVYAGLPCLERARQVLRERGIKRCLMPGELYVKRPDGARTRVFDVVHYTKAPKSQEDLELLNFAPFDILWLDNEGYDGFAEVITRLRSFEGSAIAPPPIRILHSTAEIERAYDEWVNRDGCEGLMIRTDLTYRYKLKADHTIDAAIIGYTDDGDEKITSVLTGLVTEDGNVQVLGPVEKGFSDIDRMELYRRLSEARVESDYMEVSRFYTPFHMVRPRIVIEFSTNDMVAEHANGMPIKKAVLRLKDNVYRLQRSAPLVALKHAVFNRFREDKVVNATDTRLAQITDQVFIDLERETSRDISFPDTEIIAREVYLKETKGKVSLRKLVAWKTNKDHIDSAYTAFVFNYTDYSPGRQEPLKQDIRISSSKEQIMEIFAEFKKDNILSGWKKV